jgi:hypothetical protein
MSDVDGTYIISFPQCLRWESAADSVLILPNTFYFGNWTFESTRQLIMSLIALWLMNYEMVQLVVFGMQSTRPAWGLGTFPGGRVSRLWHTFTNKSLISNKHLSLSLLNKGTLLKLVTTYIYYLDVGCVVNWYCYSSLHYFHSALHSSYCSRSRKENLSLVCEGEARKFVNCQTITSLAF